MGRANVLNTGTTNYLELIGNGKTYRVPPYQRDYAWTEEEWEDLWNDIAELRGQPDGRHYLGALVVQARSDRELLVIDGQQRLATIAVLALAIIQRLRTPIPRRWNTSCPSTRQATGPRASRPTSGRRRSIVSGI